MGFGDKRSAPHFVLCIQDVSLY